MKAREGSRRFSNSKKRLAPGGSLRKNVWRQGEVCEKTSGARGKFAKKRLASKGLSDLSAGVICECLGVRVTVRASAF